MKLLKTLVIVCSAIAVICLFLWAGYIAVPLAVVAVLLALGFGAGYAAIGLYGALGRARMEHAQVELTRSQAWATSIEASKIKLDVYGLVTQPGQGINITVLPRPETGSVVAASAATQPQQLPAGLPTAPSLSQLLNSGFYASSDRMLLGYNHSGPIYGSVEDLLSTAVAGRPGQGKSSLLRLVAAQMLMIGGLTVTLDPHGSISEDVPGVSVYTASTAAELNQVASWMLTELEKRLAAYRRGQRQFRPLMALNDEFPVISLSSKDAVAAISRIVLEGRKVKMFSLISGQGLPASQFGGSLVRDALSSRYIFQTTTRQGQMAGLDKDAQKLLDLLEVGRCVLDGPVKPQIVAIPNATPDDLLWLVNSRQGATTVNSNERERESEGEAQGSAGETEEYYNQHRAEQSPAKQEQAPSEAVIEGDYRELPPSQLPEKLKRALEAFREGAASVSKLAQALGCSTGSASSYLQALERLGYIRRGSK